MVNKSTGLKRHIIDKYYTKEIVVDECIKLIKNYINIDNDNDLCIEPSAGNGSFINYIKLLCNNYKFYDLEPENVEIIKQDYLLFDYKNILSKFNKIHIIGNPPFGRQSSLAIKFIKKSTEYCDSISFILPKSFKKDSLKKHFPLNFHLLYEYELPNNSFIINNKEHNVPCIFQIWIKKNINRNKSEKLFPINFEFVKKDDNHDISFRRVGVNAGKIDEMTMNKSIQSHYFIKFNNNLDNELIEQLKKINYDCKNNTVGPKSISKQELIKEFNMILK